jgi:predicted polyphosphate/ATP-dependent NAD kinase
MLARSDVDIIAIFINPIHGRHIIQALKQASTSSVPALVTSIEDARQVLSAAQRTGRKLLVGRAPGSSSLSRQRQAYSG